MNRFNKCSLAILIFPLLFSLISCGEKKEEEKLVKLHMNSYEETETIFFPYRFNLESYINITDEPNSDIAKMSMLFTANIATYSEVIFEKTDYPVKGYSDNESFYKHLELDDYYHQAIGPTDEGVDPNDISQIYLAHKEINVKDQTYDICFITMRDSDQGVAWSSDFDIGYDDDSYYSKTGEHPEWTNKENHKGFDVAANRSLVVAKNYFSTKLNKNAQQIFYLFGHSRGAALINIMAAKLIDDGINNVVAYGLAVPQTTTYVDANNAKYNHIFSYVNTQDIITSLPSKEWGFKRYGKDYAFDIKEYRNRFEVINQMDSSRIAGSTTLIGKKLARVIDTRSNAYKFDNTFTIGSSDYLSSDQIDSFVARYMSPLSGTFESLKSFVEVLKDTNDEELTRVTVRVCPGFYMNLLGIVIGATDFDFSDIRSKISALSDYTNVLLDITGIGAQSILQITPFLVVAMHYFQTYATYFNL